MPGNNWKRYNKAIAIALGLLILLLSFLIFYKPSPGDLPENPLPECVSLEGEWRSSLVFQNGESSVNSYPVLNLNESNKFALTEYPEFESFYEGQWYVEEATPGKEYLVLDFGQQIPIELYTIQQVNIDIRIANIVEDEKLYFEISNNQTIDDCLPAGYSWEMFGYRFAHSTIERESVDDFERNSGRVDNCLLLTSEILETAYTNGEFDIYIAQNKLRILEKQKESSVFRLIFESDYEIDVENSIIIATNITLNPIEERSLSYPNIFERNNLGEMEEFKFDIEYVQDGEACKRENFSFLFLDQELDQFI